jgi:hypothetical protein
MEKLVRRFAKFRTEVFGKKKELFARLSQTQEPRALFITCSDSRIDPTLMTQAEPDELFILRNAGNMVAPYGAMQGGSTATIEFAKGKRGSPWLGLLDSDRPHLGLRLRERAIDVSSGRVAAALESRSVSDCEITRPFPPSRYPVVNRS